MFDHVGFGVSNLAQSKAFFASALEPLGVAIAMEGPYGVGMGQKNKPSLWLEPATLARVACIAAIVAGILGLKLLQSSGSGGA